MYVEIGLESNDVDEREESCWFGLWSESAFDSRPDQTGASSKTKRGLIQKNS